MKRTVIILLIALLLFPCSSFADAKDTYSQAQELLSQSKYTEAAKLFDSISTYEDSSKLAMYCKACSLCESGYYDMGIVAFDGLGDFKDSPMRITYYKARSIEDKAGETDWNGMEEAIAVYSTAPVFLDSFDRIAALILRIESAKNAAYDNALALIEIGKYGDAYDAFIALGAHNNSTEKAASIRDQAEMYKIEHAEVGDDIIFGTYEQDNKDDNGKEAIEWLVLAKENNRLLVISRYALDCIPYNEKHTDVTWETCTLRKWLNNDFLKVAFSNIEQAMIPTMTVSTEKNPSYSSKPGNPTQDKVFLLSISEANRYFSYDSARQCKPTVYAKEQGVYAGSNGFCWWWLRSPGNNQGYATDITKDGHVRASGEIVNMGNQAVRPALWIELEPQ